MLREWGAPPEVATALANKGWTDAAYYFKARASLGILVLGRWARRPRSPPRWPARGWTDAAYYFKARATGG